MNFQQSFQALAQALDYMLIELRTANAHLAIIREQNYKLGIMVAELIKEGQENVEEPTTPKTE